MKRYTIKPSKKWETSHQRRLRLFSLPIREGGWQVDATTGRWVTIRRGEQPRPGSVRGGIGPLERDSRRESALSLESGGSFRNDRGLKSDNRELPIRIEWRLEV